MSDRRMLRVAAVADVHFGKTSRGALQPLVDAVSGAADVLVVCGDLTQYGQAAEARGLVQELASIRIPILAVLGNHDHHAGEQDEIATILGDAGMRVLDGDFVEIEGVGFAGVKGFGGGFGPRLLEPWGEATVKTFVHDAVTEGLKLESALARLKMSHRIVLLHYSPIRDTVDGEPLEIYPFLGSSRLEDPINRFQVSAVFHGHAHHGQPEGRTSAGIPVYNVSMPLMTRLDPGGRPFRLFEIALGEATPG